MSVKPIRSELLLPILLFNDECAVCRHIAHWVQKSAKTKLGTMLLIVQPIGENPAALHLLSPGLNIWDAYATIHLLMPDRSFKLGGEAVAEVFRRLPGTRWFAWSFGFRIFGFRPFQAMLNMSYAILADVRPVFGCESCGTPKLWIRPVGRVIPWVKGIFGARPTVTPRFTPLLKKKLTRI